MNRMLVSGILPFHFQASWDPGEGMDFGDATGLIESLNQQIMVSSCAATDLLLGSYFGLWVYGQYITSILSASLSD